MIGRVVLAVVDRGLDRLRDRLDLLAVAYLARRRDLDPFLGKSLLERLAGLYGAKVELHEGPGA